MGSKSRINHPRSSQFLRKSSSNLIFTVLITCSFFILILLAFVILSIPTSSSDSPKAHEVNSIVHRSVESKKNGDERSDQWVEVISWEPRAVVYHNFTVRVSWALIFCTKIDENVINTHVKEKKTKKMSSR
ncbi:putative procollagen-proline 4-dioxygenase [Helianthus debilis subsp. tardiflorus]